MYTVDINKLRRVAKAYRLGREWNKVFGIGSHKTGTTTLDFILDALGFNCAPQQKLEKECTLELRTGNYYPLRKYIDRFDFFQDSPFASAHHYVALDANTPAANSSILTVILKSGMNQTLFLCLNGATYRRASFRAKLTTINTAIYRMITCC